jgi:hypothetical protein
VPDDLTITIEKQGEEFVVLEANLNVYYIDQNG